MTNSDFIATCEQLADSLSLAQRISALNLHSPVGLIAGSGTFPLECAANLRLVKIKVVGIAHIGETDPSFEQMVDVCHWMKLGKLGKIIRIFKAAGVRQAAFAGGIRRVSLFNNLRLDWRGVKAAARLRGRKDDQLLRMIAGELERDGIAVFAASALLDQSTPQAGLLTKRDLTDAEREDALVGWDAARAVGGVDIGQTIIAQNGVVVAVEAIEGTDAAIERAGKLAPKGCVVVKLCKPHQDQRMDLPTVGPDTIGKMLESGASALVLEANKSIVLDPIEVVASANRAGIAILVAAARSDIASS